jgi:ABC-type multidrug transport system fused ATPase/permease subunit
VPFISIYLIDTVIPDHNLRALVAVSLVIVAMTALYLAVDTVKGFVVLRTSRTVAARIEVFLLWRVQMLPMSFLSSKDPGYLLSRFVNDLSGLNQLATDTILNVAQHSAVLVIGLFAVFYIHPRLALASLCILPGFVVVNARYSAQLRAQGRLAQEKRSQSLEALNEAISGVFVTRVFTRERWELLRVFRCRAETIRVEVRNFLAAAKVSFLVSVLGAAGPLVVLCYGGYEIIQGRLTIGALIGFNSVLAYLHGPTQALTTLYLGGQHALAALDRIAELLEMRSETGLERGGDAGRPMTSKPAHAIEFDAIRFGYRSEQAVLDGVSFTVPAGSVAAIIGGSGAGKSSIVNLLFRLYEPDAGTIRIDGVDIRDYDLYALRKTIGLVSQETTLFTGTILENIRFGRPRASVADVVEAATLAYAHEFIDALPQGYDTPVGRMGYQLSAGQRQRIALARTILSAPEILVLDEATSSIDSQSEELIWKALSTFARGRTTIVISHRLASVLDADVVIHLRNGVVADVGSHRQLMTHEAYRSLYGRQLAAAR